MQDTAGLDVQNDQRGPSYRRGQDYHWGGAAAHILRITVAMG